MKKIKKMLTGRRIVLTQNEDTVEDFKAALENLGAEVCLLPLIESKLSYNEEECSDIFSEIATYEWGIFTSVHGVRNFFQLFLKKYPDIRCLGPMKFACVGTQTAKEIQSFHLTVDMIPSKFTTEALAKELIEKGGIENMKLLIVTGDLNDAGFIKKLESEGRGIVDSFQVYKTKPLSIAKCPQLKDFCKNGADAILFSSASAVKSYKDQIKEFKVSKTGVKPLFGSIGPVTSKILKEEGLDVAFEAKMHTKEGFIEILLEQFAAKK